jgi:hypothetical protein
MSEHETRRNDKHFLFQLLKIKSGENIDDVIAQYSASMDSNDVDNVYAKFKALTEKKN